MSATSRRLTELFQTAPELPFDNNAKFIFFSDCHRGDNSWADDFAHNQTLFFHALEHYLNEGFTYIELGDGDELWENHNFAEIQRQHSHVFWLMRQFFLDGRLILIYGNHDLERQDPDVVRRTLYYYEDERLQETLPLFPGIELYEALKLRHTTLDGHLFLVHGHQGDLWNDRLWRLSRVLVRHLWRHAQLLGVNNPASPAKNFKKRSIVEGRIAEWIVANDQPLVCGHTHQSKLPAPGAPPYFNTGSCVHPRAITGIELVESAMTLVKWSIRVRTDASLFVDRTELVGPVPLATYWA